MTVDRPGAEPVEAGHYVRPSPVDTAAAALRGRGEVRDFAFLADHPDPEVRELFAEIRPRYPVR